MLYIVATPIGHLDDISLRALNTLKTVDCILAEDTRHTKKLLQHYQINTPLISLHDHNEKIKTPEIIAQLAQGKVFALVSDAGTPLISDPGFVLVSEAKKHNIEVSPIPGASALISALSASGLPCDCFSFFGFLPNKKTARLKLLQQLSLKQETLIFYESPKRILASIEDMINILGQDRLVCIAKEMTKHFESIISLPLVELQQWLLADTKRIQGEFVVIIAPQPAMDNQDQLSELNQLAPILLSEMSASKSAKILAKITGLDKKTCYNYCLNLE